jgi:L-lactate dehydrogenase (cytochrome)/(S)-mandelate dehydrogenase
VDQRYGGPDARFRDWPKGSAVKVEKAINIEDLRRMAKRRLPRIFFDYIEGGVEDEDGLRRNEAAFRNYRLLPRYLVDVSRRDQSVSLFGRTYSSAVGISPTGLNGMFRRNADVMLAEVAAETGIPYIVSSVSNIAVETAARIAPHLWFQIYPANDRSICEDMARRARDAGVSTLVLTVDVPLMHKRERNMRNGFTRPMKMTPAIILDAMRHPAWLIEYIKHGGGLPVLENWAGYSPPGSSADIIADQYGTQTPSPGQTWRDFESLRRIWPGNLVVKGILHKDDAARAVALGADGIYVSNHGGRQLDRAPSPIDVLPGIRAAVGDQVTVLMDSGIRRGSDVVIARCLGAEAAFVGRATLYGAVAGGRAGARKAVDILRKEIDLTLAAVGCATMAEVGPHLLFDETGSGPVAELPERRRKPHAVKE